MGLYVEVMCDVMNGERDPKDILRARCFSHRCDNPQGRTVASARKEARRTGWRVGPGARAICPGCIAALPLTESKPHD